VNGEIREIDSTPENPLAAVGQLDKGQCSREVGFCRSGGSIRSSRRASKVNGSITDNSHLVHGLPCFCEDDSEEAFMRTGETVTDLGLYISECCGEEVIFDTGDQLAKCSACSAPCSWELEEEIISLDEFKHRTAA
jgi:hypothetical protein